MDSVVLFGHKQTSSIPIGFPLDGDTSPLPSFPINGGFGKLLICFVQLACAQHDRRIKDPGESRLGSSVSLLCESHRHLLRVTDDLHIAWPLRCSLFSTRRAVLLVTLTISFVSVCWSLPPEKKTPRK